MQKLASVPIGTLVMLFMCAAAQPLLADAKDSFKQGCESGHGSYVENVDNVQCNTSGGTTITCDYKITKCSVSAQIVKPFEPTKAALKGYMTRDVAVPGWHVIPMRSKSSELHQTTH